MRELSGRSRAILKQYFETADPYTFAVGHRTVAFTEPQVYHIQRVLTDKAINMSCSAMEKMVIGAVKGTPATAPSRNEQFRTRTWAPTPGPHQVRGSSSKQLTTDLGSGSDTHGDFSALQEVEDISLPDDSDRPAEMALIAETFKRSTSETVAGDVRVIWRRS